MNELASHLALLRDPRLAALATAATPAWLWSTDATRILWANPVGAAIFGAFPAELPALRLDPRGQVTTQITRVLGTLRLGGGHRLERLRGFGTGISRALTCNCSRIVLDDYTPGVLVVAVEAAGPALPLAQRIRRLYDGSGLAIAAFAPDGNVIYATRQASARLAGGATLATLGATQLGADAVAHGRAEGDIPLGRITIVRLGADATMALVTTLPSETAVTPSPRPEPLPHVVTAPPTIPATPIIPEAPPVAPVSPEPTAADPSAVPAAPGPPTTPDAAVAPPTTIVADAPDTTAEGAPTTAAAPLAPPSEKCVDTSVTERRHPLRFVWQMDANGRFTLGSDEFTEVIGPRIAVALGRPWKEINDELALDPENQVGRAVATHDTWSGITVSWPVDGTVERLTVELSGLPIYDRNRSFLGYRGFGVCRDVDRLATLAVMRRSAHAAGQPAPDVATHVAADVAAPPAPPASEVATPQAATEAVETRPTLTLVPKSPNVLPFRSTTATPAPDAKSPGLNPIERNAFHELARQLTTRLRGDPALKAEVANEQQPVAAPDIAAAAPTEAVASVETTPVMRTEPAHTASPPPSEGIVEPLANTAAAVALAEPAPQEPAERPLLDRLPLGVLVYRLDTLLYANRAFLDWTGYPHLDALADAGGLDSLFVESGAEDAATPDKRLMIATPHGEKRPVEARLFSVPWEGETALVLMLANMGLDEHARPDETELESALEASETSLRSVKTALQATEASLRRAEAQAREFKMLLDTATDAVVMIGPSGRVASANRGAETLFGYDAAELTTRTFADLFAPESRSTALEYRAATLAYLDGGARNAGGREVIVAARQGGATPLLMTLVRIDESQRVCAVLRDITRWKAAEGELVAARDTAEKASAAKSDFLAKISHEIRTPLNSIIGFSEVMLEERFGPIGNERYRNYLKDIHGAGDNLVALVNDLLDLAKIEAGKLDLAFTDLNLNELVQAAVAQMQPQANRERIIIRTSLAPALRPVVADARGLRQIALNLLSNSIKFTGAGGQVIISTASADNGDVLLRVRDTGIGMDEKEIDVALEPFRQLATAARWGSGGTGLGLPLTKALAEANRARFTLTSKINDGTLVEIAFPATHAHAE
ncbi:MAG TPA: histidine kinase dimerization/phospho-acceptor domain-containing protein [Xanthobacteraceae bacterium]|jgi:PAS domain S-box-containing protein